MTEIPDNRQALQPEQETPVRPRPVLRGPLIVLGMVTSAPVVGFLSKDWCCTTIGCTLFSAFLIAVSDLLLAPLVRRGRCTRKMQFLPMLIILGILAALFVRSPTRVFKRVFGVSPPPGVRDLALDSALWGQGGGEEQILMRFKADQETMAQLLKHRGFAIDEDTMKTWSEQTGSNWTWLWNKAFYSFSGFGGRAWRNVEPMLDPILYRCHIPDAHATVRLLWDRASGRAYLLDLR